MCNTLTDAPQWTEKDRALARDAAALIRSEAWREDPTLGVGKPHSYASATTNQGFIIQWRMGKGQVARSSTTAAWFAKNKKRKRGDDVVKLGVPLPPRPGHDRTVPGTYADMDDAEIDKIRFAFWARLGQPDLTALMDLLKAEFPQVRDTYISAIKARRTRVIRDRETAKKAKKERRRQSLKEPKDLAAKMSLPEAIEEYGKLEEELKAGQHTLVNWGDQLQFDELDDGDAKEEKMKKAYSAKAENLRFRVARQAQALIIYFRGLKERAEARLKRTEQLNATTDDEFDAAYDELVSTRDANVHEIADEVAVLLGDTLGVSLDGRTLRGWATYFREHRVIEFDKRGLDRPEHFLDDEDVKTRVQEWMIAKAAKAGADGLSVDTMQHFINTELIPELMAEKDEDGELKYASLVQKRLKLNDGSAGVARSTAHAWMKRLGADRQWYHGDFYTDIHEKPEVVAYRKVYLERSTELELRVKAWHIVPIEEFRTIRSGVDAKAGVVEDIKIDAPFFFRYDADGAVIPARDPDAATEAATDTMGHDAVAQLAAADEASATHVEFHADTFADLRDRGRAKTSVRWTPPLALDVCEKHALVDAGAVCKCHLPAIRVGQDESIYKANAMPKGVWVVCQVKNIRKKVDGVGEMVSCFVDENLGLGLRLTTAERERLNTYRVQQGRAPFAEGETPGRCHLEYGKSKEGYWGFAEMLKQTQDVMDMYAVLFPGYQIVFEFDNSSGHTKGMDDGLYLTFSSCRRRVTPSSRGPGSSTGGGDRNTCFASTTRAAPAARRLTSTCTSASSSRSRPSVLRARAGSRGRRGSTGGRTWSTTGATRRSSARNSVVKLTCS